MNDRKQITLRIPDEVYEALKDSGEQIGLNIKSMILLAVAFELGLFLKTHQQQ